MKATTIAIVLAASTCSQLATVGANLRGATLGAGAKQAASGVANPAAAGIAGDGSCIPQHIAANVQQPIDVCQEGFNLNMTGLGQTVCVKKVYREVPSCFRSIHCPADMENVTSEKVCFPPEVRGALVGMLTVFRIHATLPFKLLPALKSALVKAATLPVQLISDAGVQEANTPDSGEVALNTQRPELQMPRLDLPDIKLRSLIRQTTTLASAGQDVAVALAKGKDPMVILTNSMANINLTEFMDVMPKVDAWVSEKLQGLTNVNNVTAEISSKFPDCLYRCCTTEVVVDTSVALATKACPDGLNLNSLLNVCVSESGYASCPQGMKRCDRGLGQLICVVERNSSGQDSCKLAGSLSPALLKHRCPLPEAAL